MKTVLTIAGSDSSGGAGIQADIKTMTMNGVFAMSAITALTAQNTEKITDVLQVPADFLGEQLDAVFTDIRPDAVKIGMVSSADSIKVIAQKLTEYHAENIVIDPVMAATSGRSLLSNQAFSAFKDDLLPLAFLITPNIPETECLSGLHVQTQQDMAVASEKLSQRYGCAVLCKGGHKLDAANDLLYFDGKMKWFCQERIENKNTHGTGCTLSSAIASNLAKGFTLEEAVERAKEYITGAIAAKLDLGKGNGPLNHAYSLMNR